jgi:hypothetical protein
MLIFYHYLACICLCFSCCLYVCIFFLCRGVHRQANRHSREISEIVPAHRRAHTHAEITRTPLSCGGDDCDVDSLSLLRHICIRRHACMHVCLLACLGIRDSWLPNSDSLSLLIQSYIPTCILVCLCMYIFVLFFIVFLSIPYSWLPTSLFLLGTGSLILTTTSCRPCHRTFSPGFHRFSEYACFSWLRTEILCLSESVDFLSLLGMYLPVFFVLLVCVYVFLCHGVHRQTNRHS